MTAATVPGPLAAACPQVRPAAEADAVAGRVPGYVAAPASTQEASAVLAAAAGLGLAVVPRGAGTRLHWGAPPDRCDLVLDTRRLDRIIEHAAGDLVVRVQAGVLLADLAGRLAAAGQRLATDPPPGGTVGGLIATGVAGPLRLRYGGPRDLLIGTTVVLADGTVARSGGKVVKNVAGYDLGKLFAGSNGTLGLVTEAAFRLHPVPQAVAYVTAQCPDAGTAQAMLAQAAASVLAPSAAELYWPGRDGPAEAAILLEGDPDGVAERADQLSALLAGAGLAGAGPAGAGPGGGTAGSGGRGAVVITAQAPPWWGRGAAAAADGTVLRIAFWAGRCAAVLNALAAAGAAADLDPVVSGSAAAGVLHAALPAGAPPAAVAEFVAAARAAVRRGAELAAAGHPAAAAVSRGPGLPPARIRDRAGPASSSGTVPGGSPGLPDRSPSLPGGSVVVVHAPPAVRDLVDLWGPVPADGLMRAVKDQFDPGHRMAPGRFAGGI